jgi:hypothetical protein
MTEPEPANADAAGIPDPNAPKYLFADGPLHGLLLPVGGPDGNPVLHTESGTKYVMVTYTYNEAHPITGHAVPTWQRFVYVSETLAARPVSEQMTALGHAVMAAWFRTGDRVQTDSPVLGVVDAPTPEHTMTCIDGGEACFSFTHASLAKAAKAASEHNTETGHHIKHDERTPEPPMPGDGSAAQTEETSK